MTSFRPSLIDLILTHKDITKRPNGGFGQHEAWCPNPSHPDKAGGKASLRINNQKYDGRGVVKCFVCGFGGMRKLAELWELIDPKGKASLSSMEIETTYDYHAADGSLLFQVVRFKASHGADKIIRQRRPDPEKKDTWIWDLKGIRPILYRLPELRAAPADQWVFIDEGEKDVDNLIKRGLVATTNPMGAGKWRKYYNHELKGRKVAVLRDNDEPGKRHQLTICNEIQSVTDVVKAIELAGLPPKGDVTDWLEMGHNAEELVALAESAEPYQTDPMFQPLSSNDATAEWKGGKHRPVSRSILSNLTTRGFFVNGGDNAYFFDKRRKILMEINKDNRALKLMLNQDYEVNRQDDLYKYLIEQMEADADATGVEATVAKLNHYDETERRLLLDMGNGNVLVLDGGTPKVRENGADGVLFAPLRGFQPWRYMPDAETDLIEHTLLDSLKFDDSANTVHDPDEAYVLVLIWIHSLAFESIQPTKGIALAVGPSGSGKSNFMRRVGRMIMGDRFQVRRLKRDKESDFWTAVTNNPFICFDNADEWIPWLPDALATLATGVALGERKFYTNNEEVDYEPRCFVGLTARTPRFRREDVASRLIIFHMKRLTERVGEKGLLDQIASNRNGLMSDYANKLNKVVGTPFGHSSDVDQSIRLADFSNIAAWIGNGLGPVIADKIVHALNKLRASQFTYATEEDDLFAVLDAWIGETYMLEGSMMAPEPNNGRRVTTKRLLDELNSTADGSGINLRVSNSIQLGKRIDTMQEALSVRFKIGSGHGNDGNWWSFELLDHE